ncbi:type I DNA topoisomerase [Brevundimonas variabilis]|uniref:DNA topoisomerase 1 n=1 Tax=Brevundimonas variabilis TaxID=74312 RepID=A0A7W9CHI4_9CAUL|nr:type I DNA topoisomerase [Brevundimonas variabilis]MBB5745740.1 DNA topoisomerase-1 [Brevundimonas variabilis]
MNLVIVESPAKAKTINKYLGSDFEVLASYGHIRDLPSKDGSVKPDEDFAMEWEIDARASTRMSEIAAAAKRADRVILATDPDREGEAISWHVLEVLTKKKALKDTHVERVTFNAITKSAVLEAMAAPRQLDMELVEAYLARRALDYLVGFTLSPVLWRKLPGARSAGRVQSVALRIVVDRELEIERFRPQEYWSVEADLVADSPPFTTRLVKHAGKRIQRLDIPNEAMAFAARDAIQSGDFTIRSIEKKPVRRSPAPPFTTSTLQQEASRKLGFDAQRTMRAAQKLYEGVDETGGLITYMRTDGVQTTPEGIAQAREVIADRFGPAFVPSEARYYKTKAKNAQEAHEAIRPTNIARHPDSLRLESDLQRLYELIWKRMVASQMESARMDRTTVEIETPDGQTGLRATGQVVTFDGFLAVYEEGRDERQKGTEGEDDDDSTRLPALKEGAKAKVEAVRADQHFTEPPPRFSEATLVKKLEELGIGRPSTYASILTTLRDREYVRMDKNRFIPEDNGRLVTAFLEQFFRQWVEYDFTAGLENQLDEVSAGQMDWKALLRDFWGQLKPATAAMLERQGVIDELDEAIGPFLFPPKEDGTDARLCPACGNGRLHLKASFKMRSSFIGCSNYPECRYTRGFGSGASEAETGTDRELGLDPETGQPVHLKIGRFGPYVETTPPEAEKPKRSSLPKGWSPASLTLESALRLLALPREVGMHPEDGKPITAGLGRYGPFVLHAGTYANVADIDEVFEVGLNRAVVLLAEKRAGKFAGRGQATAPLKDLGAHPETGDPVQVMAGRFGPYVKSGKINATLPKGTTPEDLTMEQALPLLAAKAGAAPKKKVAAKKAPAKKAAPAKAAAKPAAKPAAAKKKAAPKKAKAAG